jgi:hypothetical protein
MKLGRALLESDTAGALYRWAAGSSTSYPPWFWITRALIMIFGGLALIVVQPGAATFLAIGAFCAWVTLRIIWLFRRGELDIRD